MTCYLTELTDEALDQIQGGRDVPYGNFNFRVVFESGAARSASFGGKLLTAQDFRSEQSY